MTCVHQTTCTENGKGDISCWCRFCGKTWINGREVK